MKPRSRSGVNMWPPRSVRRGRRDHDAQSIGARTRSSAREAPASLLLQARTAVPQTIRRVRVMTTAMRQAAPEAESAVTTDPLTDFTRLAAPVAESDGG